MPRRTRNPLGDAVLYSVNLTARWIQGYRYLDRCGECLVRLEDRLELGWIPVETSPTSGSMKNEPLGLALSFNSEGVNVRQTLFLDSAVFLDQSCTIYDTLRKTLEIDRIATPALRVFYQVGFAADQVDDAERELLEMNLCEVNASLLNAMGGENFAVQFTTVTRDKPQIQKLGAQMRRRFQAVVVRQERQHTVDSRLLAQARSLGKKQADAIVAIQQLKKRIPEISPVAIQFEVESSLDGDVSTREFNIRDFIVDSSGWADSVMKSVASSWRT